MGDAGKFVKRVFQATTLPGQAWANQEAAQAQGDIANAQLAQQQADRQQALQYATPSAEEIAQLNRATALNEADITRKERLIASSDPALIEAGAQALQLLKGEEAKTLNPLKSRLAKEEQTLRERLRAQLGSGYENTTAGIQALSSFQEASGNALATAQQQSLAQLLGVAQDTSSRYGTQSNIANAGVLAGLRGNINSRQVAALTGTPITNAGANFVSDLQSARAANQTFGQLIQVAGLAAPYLAGAGGPKSPTSTGLTLGNQTTTGQTYYPSTYTS